MKRAINISLVALALGVGFAACDQRDETRRSDAPATKAPADKAPASTARMSDSDLENAVKTKLNADEQLRAADLKVNANADKNEVTLSGTVKSQDLRNKAVDMAKNAHSGITVNDKIDVKPAA